MEQMYVSPVCIDIDHVRTYMTFKNIVDAQVIMYVTRCISALNCGLGDELIAFLHARTVFSLLLDYHCIKLLLVSNGTTGIL